jgi:hypothetical protein
VVVATFATSFDPQSLPEFVRARAVFAPDLREVTVALEPQNTVAFLAQVVATLEPSAEFVTVSVYAAPLDNLGE